MKTFKQFLIESRGFDQIEVAMEVFEDEIRFVRKGKGFVEYEMTEGYWKAFTEEKFKKLQSYFGDDVYISYFEKTGILKFYKAVGARVAGIQRDVHKLGEHDVFYKEVLNFIESKGWRIVEKELYADSEVADKLNVWDEIFFLTDDGILVLSGATSWAFGKEHLVSYENFNKLAVGDVVYLFFDEGESDRIKRFKYLGTK